MKGIFSTLLCTLTVALLLSGCGKSEPACSACAGAKSEEAHGHKAAHGGCLNALGTCANGHAEVKIEENLFKLWFVGGEKDTDKAVRVPDKEITLEITPDGEKSSQKIVLTAKPNTLGEEKIGNCSFFEGQREGLKNIKKFVATGVATFRGKSQEIRVEYPEGYDPD